MPAHILGEPLVQLRSNPDGPSTRGGHRLQSIATCEMHWFLRYVLGCREVFPKPWLVQGTLFHLCAAYYYAEQLVRLPDWALERTLTQRMRDVCPHIEEWRQGAVDCFAAYKREHENEPFRAIAVEVERWATLGELGHPDHHLRDELVTCKNDLEVALPETGEIGIVDFKTQALHGSSFPSAVDGAWRIDWQAAYNLTITRAHYRREGIKEPVRGFMIVRATRKPPFKFDRSVVPVAQGIYTQVPGLVALALENENRLLASLRRREKPRRDGVLRGACYSRYGACEFAGVCSAPSVEAKKSELETNFVRHDTGIKL